METIFSPELSKKIRSYLTYNTPELGTSRNPGVSVAVINTADKCSLTCPNCLFSAAAANKVFSGSPPALTTKQMERFVDTMNGAGLELLVFSGGGESYENLDAMCYAVENLKNLKQVVSITSAYFGDEIGTFSVLDRLTSAMLRGNEVRSNVLDFVLRISLDTFHKVPIQNVVRVIDYARLKKHEGLSIRPIVRTLLDPRENLDLLLASALNAKLVPSKDPNDPAENMPIIDAFPTRWLVGDDMEIPVIYKPTYFLGLGSKQTSSRILGTSWREVKAAEETENSFFNLSLRGNRGEGHNFYETILLGNEYWQTELNGTQYYTTPKQQEGKRLCIYLPANGRLIINASSPDTWLPVESLDSWEGYWEKTSRDILQRVAVSEPTEKLLLYAKEVEPDLDITLDKRNFVFQVPFVAMETPSLRLYLTLRFLQGYAAKGTRFGNQLVRDLVGLSGTVLREAYQAEKQSSDSSAINNYSIVDPIVGNEDSVWLEHLSQVDEARIKRAILTLKGE